MTGSFWLPDGASTLSSEIDSLFHFVNWASIILFVGVVVAIAYLAYRYRRRPGGPAPMLSLIHI